MKQILVGALVVLLVGCAAPRQYLNSAPGYAGTTPEQGQALFDRDLAYCRAVARGNAPMPRLAGSSTTSTTTGTYNGKDFQATTTTGPNAGQVAENIWRSYQAGTDQTAIKEQCLASLGWVYQGTYHK